MSKWVELFKLVPLIKKMVIPMLSFPINIHAHVKPLCTLAMLIFNSVTSFFLLFATIAIFGEKKGHDYVKEKHNCRKQEHKKMRLCEVNGCDGQRTQHETHFMLNQRGNNNFKALWVVLLFYVLPSQLHLMNHYN